MSVRRCADVGPAMRALSLHPSEAEIKKACDEVAPNGKIEIVRGCFQSPFHRQRLQHGACRWLGLGASIRARGDPRARALGGRAPSSSHCLQPFASLWPDRWAVFETCPLCFGRLQVRCLLCRGCRGMAWRLAANNHTRSNANTVPFAVTSAADDPGKCSRGRNYSVAP